MIKARLRAAYVLLGRVAVGLFGVALLWLAWLSAKDSVVEQARLSRLGTDGQHVVGTITRIEVERRRPSNDNGGEDRRRWEYWRFATVRYSLGGREYEPAVRHSLVGPNAALEVGAPFPLIVLPGLPQKPYAPDIIAGSWVAVILQPVMLALLAGVAFVVARSRTIWTG